MTRLVLMMVSLVALVVAVAVVLPGCSSDATPVVVAGLYEATIGPLTLTLEPAAKSGDDEQLILGDATLEFDDVAPRSAGKEDGGTCYFLANIMRGDVLAARIDDHDIDLEGDWTQVGNLVTADLSEVATGGAKPTGDAATINLVFTSAGEGAGTIELELDGSTYEGTLAVTETVF